MTTRSRGPSHCLRCVLGLLALLPFAAFAANSQAPEGPFELHLAAAHVPYAAQQLILGAWQGSDKVVAVGEHGVVLLSHDGGAHFEQAAEVPTSAALNDVTFVGRQGWAVGQWRVILHSSDGGNHWTMQYSNPRNDRPLFGVYFLNREQGFAVGLWSLFITTRDGGRTWQQVKLREPKGLRVSGPSLYHMFAAPDGTLFITAERGYVLRSTDRGATWSVIDTGYHGSLWSGCAGSSGRIWVGGLRGTILFSDDDGLSWRHAHSGTLDSITDLVCSPRGVFAASVGGDLLRASDNGDTFAPLQPRDRQTYTAVTLGRKGLRPYGVGGVLARVALDR